MSEEPGQVCPLCGAPRAQDSTPTCACPRLASNAHRNERTAQAAAAEDFDPVRIRPFVELGEGADSGEAGDDGEAASSTTPTPPPLAPDPTSDRPVAPSPDPDQVGWGTGTGREYGGGIPGDSHPDPAARTRFLALLALAMATLTAATLTAVLLYDSPSHSTSSEGARAPVRSATSSSRDTSATPTEPSASTSTASPSPSGTPTASPSTTSPTTPEPTGTSPTGGTSATSSPAPTTGPPPVLRPGDNGPEVTELQLRLGQIGFYYDEPDGTYDSDVENAVRSYQFTRLILAEESGVYGPTTRTSLESETEEP